MELAFKNCHNWHISGGPKTKQPLLAVRASVILSHSIIPLEDNIKENGEALIWQMANGMTDISADLTT